MALNEVSVTTDSYLLTSMEYLSRTTGLKNHDDVIVQALALTEESIRKMSAGYMLRLFHQSMKQEWFDAPIRLSYLHNEMLRRPIPMRPGTLSLSLNDDAMRQLKFIRRAMCMRNDEEAAHFAALYAHRIAEGLRSSAGICRLAYVDGRGQRPFILAQTPYDRTLRNEFNRLILEFQDRWKLGKTSGPTPPPGSPPAP